MRHNQNRHHHKSRFIITLKAAVVVKKSTAVEDSLMWLFAAGVDKKIVVGFVQFFYKD
jgi:hypothetical protein